MSDHNANRSLILMLAGGCDHSPITEFFENAFVRFSGLVSDVIRDCVRVLKHCARTDE